MTANERAAFAAIMSRQTTDDLFRRLIRATWPERDVIQTILSQRYATGPRWVGAPAKDLTRW